MKNIHIVTHFGLGDAFICRGIVMYYVGRGYTVHLYAHDRYYAHLERLYCNLVPFGLVQVHLVEEYYEAVSLVRRKGVEHLILGMSGENWNAQQFDRSFYEQAGVPWDFRFFPLCDDSYDTDRLVGWGQELQNYPLSTPRPEVIAHEVIGEGPDREWRIKRDRLPAGTFFIDKTTPFWQGLQMISKADQFHGVDSSFLNAAMLLPEGRRPSIVFHRYARPISGLYTPPWVSVQSM